MGVWIIMVDFTRGFEFNPLWVDMLLGVLFLFTILDFCEVSGTGGCLPILLL